LLVVVVLVLSPPQLCSSKAIIIFPSKESLTKEEEEEARTAPRLISSISRINSVRIKLIDYLDYVVVARVAMHHHRQP
jgi:hypothetical protein